MKVTETILGVLTALSLLGMPAAIADDTVSGAPEASQGNDELIDAGLQRLYSAQAASDQEVIQTTAPAVAQAAVVPPITPSVSSGAMIAETAPATRPAPVLYVYEFSAPWCPSCQQLAPVIAETAAKYNGFMQLVPVDIEKNQALMRKLNINLIPTVMVVDRSGHTLNRLVGLQAGVALDEILNHYKLETTASLSHPY